MGKLMNILPVSDLRQDAARIETVQDKRIQLSLRKEGEPLPS